ncbi:MAG: PEGA domain-containing protein, partial [Kofleriaceae bacterium]
TRENDPSRPAIAPGMGVRFDRLAEGSQSILERILAEKAKQAPQRPPTETTKPPLFTDTPTRVAPPPVQDALLGNDAARPSKRNDSGFNDQHTPLPKPMPFHSDADEFPEEAFEEATKVRALDELIAQTAGAVAPVAAADPSLAGTHPDLFSDRPLDELAARRSGPGPVGRLDSTFADAPAAEAAAAAGEADELPATLDPASTSPGFASGRALDRDSAPGLPSPPETSASAKAPRLLDTSPSPRNEMPSDPMEKLARTRLGMEPAFVPTRTPAGGSVAPSMRDTTTKPSGMQAVPHEPTASVRIPAKKSAAPIIILILVLLAAAGAGVWFFVLRERLEENKVVTNTPAGSDGSGSGSAAIAVGSGSAEVGGSNTPPPAGPLIEMEVTASEKTATVEVVGTDQTGPAPFKAKLEKDKAYKVRVSASGFATLEQDVTGGQDKLLAKLDPKPRTISVTSDPPGALIMLDNASIGHTTPFDIELTKAQAAKKSVKIGIRKVGYRPLERVIALDAYKEEEAKLAAQVSEKLQVQIVVVRPPPPPVGSGSAGSAAGSNEPAGSGSATPPPAGSGSGGTTGGGAGSSEPTPDFVNPNP